MTKAIEIKLSQEQLKEILDYNPHNGVFKWRICPAQAIKIGDVAGCLHHTGYVHVVYKRRQYLAHRLAWLYTYGEDPVTNIDHVDGDTSNNCISNLRLCTSVENMMNRKKPVTNTSGYKGVSWNTRIGKWHVYPGLNGKRIHLGFYINKEDAISVYSSFCLEHHGEFYRDTTKEN